MLCWPALWNGYPIVFADTGTYLSQAIQHYVGWDRPPFYSLFMLPLHATVTLWPVVIVQALIATYVLHLICRLLAPTLPAAVFIAGMAALALLTWLPWLASELMPDLFTPLLVLLLTALAWTPERISNREQLVLVTLSGFMIASQQSSLPLSCILLTALATLRWWHGPPRSATSPPLVRRILLIVLPPTLALTGLCAVNLAAHGRLSISPFGNVFLLARVIYDGPGMAALRRDCPTRRWRLCPYLDRFPADSDGFLWNPDSPLILVGGPKLVSQDADAIIADAWRTDPGGAARATVRNALTQLGRFASGDGLEPWPTQVTPRINHDFPPHEQAAYAAARQQQGQLSVPGPLATTHVVVALLGVAACLMLLPVAAHRHAPSVGFLVAVLLALPVSAAITGGLSAPHDRYQSRIMWLPPFIAMLSFAALARASGSSPRPIPLPAPRRAARSCTSLPGPPEPPRPAASTPPGSCGPPPRSIGLP